MKRLICCFALLVCLSPAFSQRVYFVYIQSETEQPFFVKMNESVFSSSASGYLILPKMKDSVYNLIVGFPGNKWTEQAFKIEIKARDHGYQLKNFGEKWGLFDLQTLSLQMSAAPGKGAITEPAEVSAFTDVLSKAANDPSLRERPVVAKQEEKPAVVQTVIKKEEVKEKEKETGAVQAIAKSDTPTNREETKVVINDVPKNPPAAVNNASTDKPAKKEDTLLVTKEKPKDPPVTETNKKTEAPVKKEEALVIKDTPAVETVRKEDAITVSKEKPKDPVVAKVDTPARKEIIPAATENTVARKEEQKVITEEEYKPSKVTRRSESSTTEGFGLVFVDEYVDGKKDTIRIVIPNTRTASVTTKEQPKEEKKFLDITTDSKEATAESKPVVKQEEAAVKKPAATAKCSSPAAESDFLRLRRRMAAEETDDRMVSEAVKYFKSKCFTVEQLKNLSTLFLNDAGKYKFFDAAYQAVSDTDNFPSLATELKDEYYINRFKAMLR